MKFKCCIHYTGYFGKGYKTSECKAGVCYYSAFDGATAGIMNRMPCVEPENGRKDSVSCDKRAFPTKEQIEAEEKETAEYIKKITVAMRTASEWRIKPKPLSDRYEAVACPVCSGVLHLSQSSYNGHVHGRCETEGCVAWME